jgi:glutathione S-transferase
MEVAMAKYMLVSFETCPWVQRSAIVLREKNVAFELRHIDRPDWFLAISPHKKVPVLCDGPGSLDSFRGGIS